MPQPCPSRLCSVTAHQTSKQALYLLDKRFAKRFASPHNALFIPGCRPPHALPSWPHRSNSGRPCPRSQAQQGQGEGSRGPSRRFHAPKHLHRPSLCSSAAAKAEGSESRPGGGSQPPWKGPGAAAGPCVRFLLASQANHSQQLSPCLAAPLMCFLLAEQTSRAAAERGELEGGNLGNPTGPEPRAPGAAFPEREQPPGTGGTAPRPVPPLSFPNAFGDILQAHATFLKSPSPRPGSAGFPGRILRERWRLLQQAGEARGRAEQGVRAFGSKEQQEKRPGQVGGRSQPLCVTSSVPQFPPFRPAGKAGGWREATALRAPRCAGRKGAIDMQSVAFN